jgi:ABC-2 type transport system permease protein
MAGSLLVYVITAVIYIFTSLMLGLLISTVVNTQLAAMLISLLLIVPTIYLSGMVFAIESMPVAAQVVSNIVPAKWYIRAVKAIMIEGLGITSVLKEVGVLCLMGIVLVTISLKKFKVRLE